MSIRIVVQRVNRESGPAVSFILQSPENKRLDHGVDLDLEAATRLQLMILEATQKESYRGEVAIAASGWVEYKEEMFTSPCTE